MKVSHNRHAVFEASDREGSFWIDTYPASDGESGCLEKVCGVLKCRWLKRRQVALVKWPNRDPLGDVGSCVNLMMLNSGVVRMGFPWERLDSPNLCTFVADNPQDQNDPFGLWQWGWPPWGNPKPKPSPKPNTPPCPTNPNLPKPKTPSDDWKTDQPGPAKQADCSLCCEHQYIEEEAKHPDEGFKNAMREKACNSMCLLSDGNQGPE